jgi:uncharacterized repeat protein (TIGR03803 family)
MAGRRSRQRRHVHQPSRSSFSDQASNKENQPMKTNFKNLFLLPALITVLNLLPAGRMTAQTFTTLHSFAALDQTYSTNSDGAHPYAGLTVAGNGSPRYGTAAIGGSAGYGTVFAVNADGIGFTNLHSFTGSDGANPWAGLVLSGSTLYGTTLRGGSSGEGTVFAVNTDGTGFTNLYHFTGGSDGSYPNGGLISAGNTLYGTASHAGSSGSGTVFAINTDGTGFRILHNFTATYPFDFSYYDPYLYYSYYYGFEGGYYDVYADINGDGSVPVTGLILAGNTLYGTATLGGLGGSGTVFSVNTDGTGFTTVHHFERNQPPFPPTSYPGCFYCGGYYFCAGFCGFGY